MHIEGRVQVAFKSLKILRIFVEVEVYNYNNFNNNNNINNQKLEILQLQSTLATYF